MHPYPFPFRSPLMGSGPAALPATAEPPMAVPPDRAQGPVAVTPWSELEAALAGPQAQALAQELHASLESQRQGLDQQLKSKTLDRSAYALTQAYLDAVEAAQAFLDTAAFRR